MASQSSEVEYDRIRGMMNREVLIFFTHRQLWAGIDISDGNNEAFMTRFLAQPSTRHIMQVLIDSIDRH